MNSGSANNEQRQTKLTFALSKSPTDKHVNPHEQQSGTQSNSNNTEGNRSKRGRMELEGGNNEGAGNHHLQVPGSHNIPTSDSDNSLFNSDRDSISTIINRNERGTDDTGPRESNNIHSEDDHKPRVIRLERLRDKADRYSSHIGFLKECRDTKVIPKGLKIDIEPSIGNNDEQFCTQWFSRLEEFSLTLISDIIAYSEGIENSTSIKIDEETTYLKNNMSPDDFKECTDIMDHNATQRRKRLSSTKRKKYHFLRYNRPERHESTRPERQPRPERQHAQGNTRSPRDAPSSSRNRDHGHSDDDCPQERARDSNRNRDYPTYRIQRGNNEFGDDRQPDRDHKESGNRNNRQSRRDDRGDAPQNEPRQSTYRDILTNHRSRPTSRPASRVNSHTSLHPRRSNQSLSRRNSRHDTRERNTNTPRDAEMQALRDQLAAYERQQPKNAGAPHEGAQTTPSTSKPATNQEIIEYITATMRSLEGFKQQLAN